MITFPDVSCQSQTRDDFRRTLIHSSFHTANPILFHADCSTSPLSFAYCRLVTLGRMYSDGFQNFLVARFFSSEEERRRLKRHHHCAPWHRGWRDAEPLQTTDSAISTKTRESYAPSYGDSTLNGVRSFGQSLYIFSTYL
jgi:hypothetical protein